MGFFVGLILGIAVGLALIVGFARCENVRSKRRSTLATTIATFARMTVEDSRKILTPDHYPSWVVFSQRQKLSSHSPCFRSLLHNFLETDIFVGLLSFLFWGTVELA